MDNKATAENVDQYIAAFPSPVQQQLGLLRAAIREAAPQAQEKISWQMPTYTLHGNLVHFAAYKNHIGFYPGPEAITVFQEELSPFKTSKGTIQFPLDKPLPLALIGKIVRFRVAAHLAAAQGAPAAKQQL